jgi:hypothetical protein
LTDAPIPAEHLPTANNPQKEFYLSQLWGAKQKQRHAIKQLDSNWERNGVVNDANFQNDAALWRFQQRSIREKLALGGTISDNFAQIKRAFRPAGTSLEDSNGGSYLT